jgi:hypothetical protein
VTTSERLSTTSQSEMSDRRIVGVFDHCTISVVPGPSHLKVVVEGATRIDTRVAWIPLFDDDEYDMAGDLKLC